LKKVKPKDDKEAIIQQLWEYILIGNIRHLFTLSHTPEELVFLNLLHQRSLKYKPKLIYFVPSYFDTKTLFDSYNTFTTIGSNKQIDKGAEDRDVTISWNIYWLFYQQLGLTKAFHINSDIQISDMKIRANILIWLPNDPTFKLVLQYKPQETKIKALLKEKGYQLMEIDQNELIKDPIKQANIVWQKIGQKKLS